VNLTDSIIRERNARLATGAIEVLFPKNNHFTIGLDRFSRKFNQAAIAMLRRYFLRQEMLLLFSLK
jgi:hypothetical protein